LASGGGTILFHSITPRIRSVPALGWDWNPLDWASGLVPLWALGVRNWAALLEPYWAALLVPYWCPTGPPYWCPTGPPYWASGPWAALLGPY